MRERGRDTESDKGESWERDRQKERWRERERERDRERYGERGGRDRNEERGERERERATPPTVALDLSTRKLMLQQRSCA